jgi:1-acyl-sn-glycerol-3-phosphate acyltransferase
VVLFATVFGYCIGVGLVLAILFVVLLQNLIGNQLLFDRLIKLLCRAIPLGFGIRVHATGRRHLDPAKPYVFMANHVNIFDPLILYGHIPHLVRAVELEDHFSWPVWGTITRRLGNVPISHRSTTRALESLQKAAELMRRGTSIAILPEGHRTRDGHMGSFMRGPFRLALNVKADIVPIVMNGAYERKSVNSPRVRPGRMDLVFAPPIPYESFAQLSERELRDTVRHAIERRLE